MRRGRPLRMRQLLGALFAFSGVIVLTAGISGGLAYRHLLDQRRNLLDRIDPAESLVSRLLGDYVDQETGVRGYALSGQRLFLDPYNAGRSDASVTDGRLAALLSTGSPAGRLLGVVEERARNWSDRYGAPSIAAVAATHQPTVPSDSTLVASKDAFDSLRSAFTALQNRLAADHERAKASLGTATDQLLSVMLTALVILILDGAAVWVALRRVVIRPLAEVAADTRVVTAGDLAHEVRRTGPVEVAELASDIEAMRGRIFAEVAQVQTAQESLEAANAELARSNEDLEQFAYVASHDLQEPLRKVASFCQLLEQRYGGQLDERGEQYISFAVDGAKRMQVLINDLLAFSRIGRTTEGFVPVSLAECLEAAVRNLAGTVESTGASVEPTAALPEVAGDRTLLVALFQNLIGNAIKFHGDEPPAVRVGCRANPDGGGEWLLSVQDNGIGIEARFAERIFVIFQRLHGRDAYAGTGIGLAMCRKIVEFHGGHIWLDTAFAGGTRFYFTLPVTSLEDPTDGRRPAQPTDLARTTDA